MTADSAMPRVRASSAAAVGRDRRRRPGSRSGSRAPPHLRARQVVRAAEGAPDEVLHLGVELDPVGGVAPLPRDRRRRADPGLAAVLAAEQADVGVGDEDAPRVEGVEVDAVAGGHVEAAGGPAVLAAALGVDLGPGRAAVQRAVGAEEVGGVADVGVGPAPPRGRSGASSQTECPSSAARGSIHEGARSAEGRSDSAWTTLHVRPPSVVFAIPLKGCVAAAGKDDPAQADVGDEREAGGGRDRAERRPGAPGGSPGLALVELPDRVEQRAVPRRSTCGRRPRRPAPLRVTPAAPRVRGEVA